MIQSYFCPRCGEAGVPIHKDAGVCSTCYNDVNQYDLGTYETYVCKHELRAISSGFSYNTYCCMKCGDILKLECRVALQ